MTTRNLVYTPHAVKNIQKLTSNARIRIKSSLEKLQRDPTGLASKLKDESLGQYRYRVGDYRVIFDIEGQNIVIL